MESMMLNGLLAAVDIATVLYWTGVVLTVAFALGFVIFVHELGHFLVARACGVKIEKFMVGFDIGGLKLSRRWGETVYGIGILPLGGYVKMLGQDDDPAHIAEQMKKSEVTAASGNAAPVIGPNGETYYVDRRSYLAKSVPQRMAIISAGVVMNVIFAFIFAVIAYGMGVPYVPSIVSETVPGSPAWQAGLEPGDEIVQIGSREDPTFMQLLGGVTLGDLEEGIPCVIRRAADDQVVRITLTPKQESGRLAKIGVSPPQSLTLTDRIAEPVLEDSPAARATLVAPAADEIKGEVNLQGGDRVIRVGDTPVEDYRQFVAELARNIDQPLRITIERPTKDRSNDPPRGAASAAAHADETQELTFEVPPRPLQQFGLVMRMGPITAVQTDSPAAKVDLREGDVIETVDGRAMADGWDPVTLPEYLRQAALERRDVELTVRRPSGDSGDTQVTMRVVPIVPTFVHSRIPFGAPMAAEAVGIAYRVENEVQSIRSGSPVAAADVALGDTITAAKIIFPKDTKGKTPEPRTVKFLSDGPGWLATLVRKIVGNDEPSQRALPNWPALIDTVQFVPAGTQVQFTFQRGEKGDLRTATLAPQPLEGLFIAERGFVFEPVTRIRQAETFAQQVRYGGEETAQALTMVFSFLRKLGTQVPVTALGGPVMIAQVAGYSAAEGLPTLLIFLTILSANLAVINFLPIPVLDGGHMVFLAYEGVRGRPASERFVVALHTAGFLLIVSLMLFVVALDLGLIPRNL